MKEKKIFVLPNRTSVKLVGLLNIAGHTVVDCTSLTVKVVKEDVERVGPIERTKLHYLDGEPVWHGEVYYVGDVPMPFSENWARVGRPKKLEPLDLLVEFKDLSEISRRHAEEVIAQMMGCEI